MGNNTGGGQLTHANTAGGPGPSSASGGIPEGGDSPLDTGAEVDFSHCGPLGIGIPEGRGGPLDTGGEIDSSHYGPLREGIPEGRGGPLDTGGPGPSSACGDTGGEGRLARYRGGGIHQRLRWDTGGEGRPSRYRGGGRRLPLWAAQRAMAGGTERRQRLLL